MGGTFAVGRTAQDRADNRKMDELKQTTLTNQRANKTLSVEIVHARRIIDQWRGRRLEFGQELIQNLDDLGRAACARRGSGQPAHGLC